MFNSTEIRNENIRNSTIINQVNQILPQSYEYNNLLDQLKTQERLFALVPENETAERLEISKKVNDLKDLIEQLKRDVLQLAEQFDRIEIKTERLQQAREFFEKGEFGEARALLNDNEEEIQSEEELLWAKRESYKTEIETKLKAKAEERLIQALLNQSDYTNSNWFADACRYFELSIKSEANKVNVFLYGYFLREHNQFTEAEKYYLQYLNDFAHQLSQGERAAGLNNLAILHEAQNNHKTALEEYEQALQIYRTLAEVNPNTYLLNVAYTLNNLAVLHRNQGDYQEALKEFEEALQIRRALPEVKPDDYLPFLATTLNNLAVVHSYQKEYEKAFIEYEEALQIYRKLAEVNPHPYLPDVAYVLNNFAGLHYDRDEFEEVLQKSEESTKIYRELAITNFQANFPFLARGLQNLALFYQKKIQQRDKSIAYAIEAMRILLPDKVEKVPFTQEFFVKAWKVLQDWNLSEEEIQQLLDEKMKETGENQA